MEGILATQDQIMSAMDALRTNFKKDGPERKTSAYIEKRLNTLDAYWNEFQLNHTRIRAEFEDPNHKYFSENYYQKALNFYNEIKMLIRNYVATEPSKPLLRPATPLSQYSDRQETVTTPADAGTSRAFFDTNVTTRGHTSRVEEMLRKQKTNFKAFTRTIEAIHLESVSERWEFEDILKTIQSRWSAIDALHWEIDNESILDNEEYELAFSEYERKYNEIKKSVNSKMWSSSYREQSTPKMDIPTFGGNYQQWMSFKDLFCESIHNNKSLPNAQKMQFLKSKVRGEAEKLIQHLRISSDNYQICWDILNHRYHNMRLIFNSHIHILLTIPNMQQQSATLIKKLHDTTNECLNAIKSMGVDTTNWDPLIVYILTQKLDAETHHDYIESLRNPRDLPTTTEFLHFLETKFTSLESSRRKQDSLKPTPQHNQYIDNQKRNSYKIPNNYINQTFQHKSVINHAATKLAQQRKCLLCSGNHALFQCKVFLDSIPENRRRIIESNSLCKNCLINHFGKDCRSEKTCRFCNGIHNTLLHNAYVTYGPSTSSQIKDEKETRKSTVCVSNGISDTVPKLLATAKINIKAVDGCYHTMRALIDPCAESSLITENAAQLLGLPRINRNCVIIGVGAKANNSKGVIKITISSLYNDFTLTTEAFVMKQVVGNLPNQSFTRPSWPHLDNIPLADPEFYKSRPVDLILSVEVYERIILPGFIRKGASQPIAQQTELGWILSGTLQPPYYCNIVMVDLNDIRRFWEMEDLSDNTLDMSSEDLQCMQHYQLQTKRQPDGRYVVRLPLHPDVTEKLGESRTIAVAQFRQLEKRFTRNKIIEDSYKQFIQEYIRLNHMAECTGHQTPEFYLPHHCVTRAESTTTATRVVFNASAKTSTGYSLNDLMYSGPNLQKDLLSLIISWRQYQIAFTADIEKMFRCIMIHKDDQDLQKIIWRDSPTEPLREYKLATVTYGTKAAPFLAMMTLKQLAKDEGQRFPQAAEVVATSFYMDDVLHGHHDVDSAIKLKSDLIALLKLGGFNLRKWSSNKPELLEHNSAIDYDQTYIFKHQESTKALGLQWQSREDSFTFQLKLESPAKLTKRILLSSISKIFDPLGWLSPVTTKLKLLFQEIWLLNLQWDDALPHDFIAKWDTIKEDINHINSVKVPRWLQSNKDDTIELHGFCDASEKAYACVIYGKVNKGQGTKPSVIIIASKSRLVPARKTISLPRLELCAAVLLTRLMKTIIQCLPKFKTNLVCWSDSTAVLGWLNGDPSRWKPFVANRVKKVVDVIPQVCWRYVRSKDNPADCASRGITAEHLVNHPLWWHGPSWLLSYDEKTTENSTYHTNEEIKKSVMINVSSVQYQNDVIDSILSKHSEFIRASRVLAWMLRMTSPLRNKPSYLTIPEIRKANNILIKHAQSEFLEDIAYIKKHNQPNPKSSLLKLNPFIDDQGILRVGGRIASASVQDAMKYPSILPHNHKLTDMLIDQAHKMTFHGGARLTLAWLRYQYWIVGGNRAVKKRLRKCVTCRKYNPTKHDQLMGNLPSARTNVTRPFFNTGVDLTGFVEVKSSKGRGVRCTKGYIVVFVCMATKAIHLELVSDLTASAFLAALRRFSARRGAPGHIYSDNGTNFIKANRVLQEEIINLKSIFTDQFYTELTEMQIEWHFNAPSWPSAGGLWEAAVKSLKYHLKRVIGEQRLTYEEFSTLLAQLEGCLNSRPLSPISEDPDDLDFLTPAHFLSGGPTLTIVETEKDLRTRWQLTQKLYQDIWKRWRTEYLTQLNSRSKWQRSQPNMKIGDIVIIHDVNLPPGKWTLGRVVELHPGKDSLVRVVSVKTKNGIIKRPVVKLSLLPINEDTNHNNQSTNNTDDVTMKPKTKPTGGTKKCIYHYITMILMMFTFLISPVHSTHKLDLNNSQSLYFDRISTVHIVRDEWKLIVYYDVEPYWEGTTLLQKYIQYLDDICTKSDVRVHCESVLLQIRHSYNELEQFNQILSNQQFPDGQIRRRRGLVNAVGNLAHSLFGVLDDQFAEQYKRDIDLIKTNQNHLAALWKNQTSVVEAEFNVLQRMKSAINKQHKMFNQYLNQLQTDTNTMKSQIQNIETSNEFLLSSIAANGLLMNLKSIQDVLLDTISEVNYGKFNIHLLKPDQLMKELNIISGKLSNELSLPINNIPSELSKMYHLLKVRAKMYKDYFIFEIKIPLVSRDNYEVYKIIPIPRKVGYNMVTLVPVSDYVAINLRKDSYIPMPEQNLKECVHLDLSTQLCALQSPIFHMKAEESLCFKNQETQLCMTKTVTCQDQWVPLYNINTYLYFCCDRRSIRIICDDQVTPDYLNNSGIILLGNDCVIKGKDVTIIAHKQQTINITLQADVARIEIPSINHIFNQNLSIPNTELEPIVGANDQELKDIDAKIKQLKSDSGLVNDISYHDVHHYVVIYLLVGACGAGAMAYFAREWRARRRPASPTLPASEQGHSAPRPAPTPYPTMRGLANAAFKYSVSDQCVSVSEKAEQSGVQPVPSVRVDESTSPIFCKHTFSEETNCES